MAKEIKNVIHCGAVITGPGVITAQDGSLAGIVHNGAGDVSVTLINGLANTEGVFIAAPANAATRALRVVHTSATVKQIVADIGGAAADTDFNLLMVRIAP